MIKKICFGLIVFLLFFGCTSIEQSSEESQLKNKSENISLNYFFGNEIIEYKEINLSQKTVCIDGNCPLVEFEEKTFTRDCYFCDLNILDVKNLRLELESSRYSSGSSDFFAGCQKKYSGKEMSGFGIISIDENKIIAFGKITTYFSQESFVCNKEKDPECDDMVYGKCSGPDYGQKFIRDVQLVFEK
jgi:hypothetical protein